MNSLTRIAIILSFIVFAGARPHIESADKIERKAEKNFYDEKFSDALPLYQEVLSIDPDNNNAKYKSEICSLLLEDYRDRSLQNILSYASTQGRRDKFYNYWLGRAYITRYRYDEAIAAWEAFLALEAYKSQIIIDEANTFIEIAQQAKRFAQNPVKYELRKLDNIINSSNSELSPTFIGGTNQMLFATRNRSDNTLQLYITTLESGQWSKPVAFNNFGTISDNTIDIDYLSPGKVLMKNENKKIEYITNVNGTWSMAQSYDFKLPGGRAKSHFSINSEENKIIYAQLDQTGNLDLFEVNKEGDKWSKPEFLVNVNTPFNEDSPYISPDGKSLYFSSEGHDAAGGFDVMLSTWDGTGWSVPKNLGYPINTIDDELHYSSNNEGTAGYLSSNRLNGNGGYDIYIFEEIKFSEIEGTIVSAANGLFAPGLRIEFHPEKFPNDIFSSISNEVGAYGNRIIAGGDYKVVIFENEEIIFEDRLTINREEALKGPVRKDYSVVPKGSPGVSLADALTTNENQQFNEDGYSEVDFIANKFRPGRKAMLKNLYFKFNSSEIRNDSESILDILHKVLRDNPDLNVMIAGHTDNLGDDGYNLWLSEVRAKKVIDRMVRRGIPQNRMKAVGYGESQPLATNDDEIDGRSLNRRIEVVVIE